jgi:hypothetical protein
MTIAFSSRACVAAAFFVVAGVFALHGPATAQTAEAPAASTELTATAEATLDGFRSAAFGDDEDAVRAAIKADFGLEGDAVKVGLNTVERTRVMTVSVPGVLADGGIAQVSYIFGYKSKTLIQVGLLWSAVTDPAITDEMMYANGDVLRAYLVSAGYVPTTITRDVVLENGILVFRGSDASGHTAILLLQGRFEDKDGTRTLFPENLTLLYAVSPDKPDILTIEKGDF